MSDEITISSSTLALTKEGDKEVETIRDYRKIEFNDKGKQHESLQTIEEVIQDYRKVEVNNDNDNDEGKQHESLQTIEEVVKSKEKKDKVIEDKDNQHESVQTIEEVAKSKKKEDNKVNEDKKDKPLNILFLYADDWSYKTLGAMGNKFVQTPRLDELAKKGVLFTHSCVTTSICMVSRATLFTGQYYSRHQTYSSWFDITMYEGDNWNHTLYPTLKKAGYYVGFFGKWHHHDPPQNKIPTFDEFKNYYGSHYLKRDGRERHITELNLEDGMNFLKNRPKDKPFALTISFFATHAEDGNSERYRPMKQSMHLYANETVPHPKTFTQKHWEEMPYFFDDNNYGRGRFNGRYSSEELYQKMMKNTFRMATEVDTASGQLIDELERQGLLNDTLVIFTTDNGNFHGHHGLAEKWYS
eukprot:CAMPEP_0184871640 /NCGR_PEP_ID=MMETSP0580-20130426/40835_1 /TAXON_ID=1118495 /ORGANISM="Dactyliosolen fragilissimus" /LENGTH=412 /DNA_ID=CAMNT_0027374327 /DNA_START=368 /DNA_END=1606 /DNA_ORIENTATION=-